MPRQAKDRSADGIEKVSRTEFRCVGCHQINGFWTGKTIKGTSLPSHLALSSHQTNIAIWQQQQQAASQQARMFAEETAAAYSPGLWNPSIPPSYQPPCPPQVPAALADLPDLPLPDYLSLEREHISIAPPPVRSRETEQERLEEQARLLRQLAKEHDEFGEQFYDDNDESRELRDAFEALGIDEASSDVESEEIDMSMHEKSSYAPWPDKTTCLLHIINSFGRLRFSRAQTKLILWLLKELEVPSVPSYKKLRQLETDVAKVVGDLEPIAKVSQLGNNFSVLDPCQTIALDLAQPVIAENMALYPEIEPNHVSEVWEALRWREFDCSQLCPMWTSDGLKRFYINEVAQLVDGALVMPLMWVTRKGVVHAECLDVALTLDGELSLPNVNNNSTSTRFVPASSFASTYVHLAELLRIEFAAECLPHVPAMPHSMRAIAEDEDVVVVFMPLWADDVSGNRSKQYNKHMNVLGANSNLPGKLLNQEFFQHFISTSQHASSAEQYSAILDMIKNTEENPIRAFNAATKRPCRVVVRVPDLPCDNPQADDESSHIKGGNHLCRRCEVGGTANDRESPAGYEALHNPGLPRTVASIRKANEEQKTEAFQKQRVTKIAELQRNSGVKDSVLNLWIEKILLEARALREVDPEITADEMERKLRLWLDRQPGDKENPLLSVPGLDPARDTPVEILHTFLLGIVKYAWYLVHTGWKDTDGRGNTFTIRFASTDTDGLVAPDIRASYIWQYRDNLTGKHFQYISQTETFHLHDLVDDALFELVKAIGFLGAVLWIPEIDDMDEYTADLRILIDNVLDAFGEVDPAKITIKTKLHGMVHTPDDVRRFGPAVRKSTEVQEKYNGVFRHCVVLGNGQADSRDVARRFGSMAATAHLVTGGYYFEGDRWRQAGSAVIKLLHDSQVLQHHLGWVLTKPPAPGCIRKVPRSSRSNLSRFTIEAQSGDVCRMRSWVVAQHEDSFVWGRISAITPSTAGRSCEGTVTLDVFDVGAALHPKFGMPVLSKHAGALSSLSMPAKNVQFLTSVQHDCCTQDCQASGSRTARQERAESGRQVRFVEHEDDEHFVINMHAMHNAHRIRRVLPRELIRPRHLYKDRVKRHHEMSKGMHAAQSQKRAETAAKAQATRAKNAAKKAAKADAQGRALKRPRIEGDGDSVSDGESEGEGDEMDES